MMWCGYALLGPAIWALLNHLDKYLLGRYFNDARTAPVLVVFTGLAGLLVATVILLFGPSVRMPTLWQVCLVMGAGALLVSSYVPYMIALQGGEPSVVASLYRMTPLFVFALSYAVLGESVQPRQIVGGLVTIAGSVSLIVDIDRKRRLGLDIRTFALMCLACLMNAGIAVIFKSVAIRTSFWGSAFWEFSGAALFSIALSCGVPSYRRSLTYLWCSEQAHVVIPLTVLGELLNLLASLSVSFAGLMAPLTVVSIVTGMHPIFLLAYGVVLTGLFPTFGKERLTRHHLLRKTLAIGVMCAGVVVTFAN